MDYANTGLPDNALLKSSFRLGYGTVSARFNENDRAMANVFYRETAIRAAHLILESYKADGAADFKAAALCLALPPFTQAPKVMSALALEGDMRDDYDALCSFENAFAEGELGDADEIADGFNKVQQDYYVAMVIAQLEGDIDLIEKCQLARFDRETIITDAAARQDFNINMQDLTAEIGDEVTRISKEVKNVLMSQALETVERFDQASPYLLNRFECAIEDAIRKALPPKSMMRPRRIGYDGKN